MEFSDFAYGILFAIAGALLLAIGWLVLKLVLAVVPATFNALADVRWMRCTFHGLLGFVVSLLVAPQLPVPLALAAGFLSTGLVAFIMHQLENVEITRSVPVRVRR